MLKDRCIMKIFNSENKKSYTNVSNEIINHESLSTDSKMVYIYIWSLPADWKIKINEIKKHFKDLSDKGFRKCLNELIEVGYLIQYRRPKNEKEIEVSNNNSLVTDYDIFETSIFSNLETGDLLGHNLLSHKLLSKYLLSHKLLSQFRLSEYQLSRNKLTILNIIYIINNNNIQTTENIQKKEVNKKKFPEKIQEKANLENREEVGNKSKALLPKSYDNDNISESEKKVYSSYVYCIEREQEEREQEYFSILEKHTDSDIDFTNFIFKFKKLCPGRKFFNDLAAILNFIEGSTLTDDQINKALNHSIIDALGDPNKMKWLSNNFIIACGEIEAYGDLESHKTKRKEVNKNKKVWDPNGSELSVDCMPPLDEILAGKWNDWKPSNQKKENKKFEPIYENDDIFS
jgi:hypothetical protein